jgi:peptidoglycan/xylan/chitin deacetylase (PgdA/CDA1 family)
MKPVASLSLDLDNLWSYLKTHGDPRAADHPTYLPAALPTILETFARRGLRITFFVVGRDAADPRHREVLRDLAASGHEIGNHSFEHEPWMARRDEPAIDAEIAAAERAIEAATGVRPTAFRGPGYCMSGALLRVLIARGYRYDASSLPTFLGPLARAYYFMSTRLTPEQRRERAELFGSWRDGARPLGPYLWTRGEQSLVEVPVTTMPGARVPFHFSYVLYLAVRSRWLALRYFDAALLACRVARVGPSLLLHPLDLIGGDEIDALGFFPAMGMKGAAKRAIVGELLDRMAAHFDLRTIGAHVDAACRSSSLRRVAAPAK